MFVEASRRNQTAATAVMEYVPSGLRYWINSASLRFIDLDDLEAQDMGSTRRCS
jgi:peptide methionine sulfoxide reductase MsrB